MRRHGIFSLIIVCLFVCLVDGVRAQSQTEPAAQSQSQRTLLSKGTIVERLNTEWNVTPDTFYHVLLMMQSSFPNENEAIRATIQAIDLTLYQMSKKAKGKAGHIQTIRGAVVAGCKKVLDEVLKTGGWHDPVIERDFPGGLSMIQKRAEAVEYGDPIPSLPWEDPAPK